MNASGAMAMITAVAAACALAAPPAGAAPSYTGRLLVALDSGERVLKTPPPGETVAELRESVLRRPGVRKAEPELYLHPLLVPNDPAYAAPDPNAPDGAAAQWNLPRQDFPSAWDISRGAGIKVAIVDTGVAASSPDLDHVAPGHDFGSGGTGTGSDEEGHGSHVAGLACGDAGNGYGIASAGFGCTLLPEKVDINSAGSITSTSAIDAIRAAADDGARVINISLGGQGSSSQMRDAVRYVWAHDAVIVAAAANPDENGAAGTSQGIPASYVVPPATGPALDSCPAGDVTSQCSRGLVVTMADYYDRNAGSGTGTGISLAAYGDSVAPFPGLLSTFPATATYLEQRWANAHAPTLCMASLTCHPRASFRGDNRFAYLFGTSMASPQVSGLAALVRSANPGMSAGQVERTIRATARGCGVWKDDLGFGIIDAGRAVAAAAGRDNTTPSSFSNGPRRSASRKIRVRLRSSDAGACGGASSGVKAVTVFAARGKRHYREVGKTGGKTFVFRGKPGRRYSFYARAVDAAGNWEGERGKPDFRVWIKKGAR